jgi:hypothetical protein
MSGKTLKELPTLCIQYLTQLFNAILLRGYFPAQWKVAQIILIPKPVHTNDVQIPQENHVKYLGLHLDRRLTLP